ncbi:MAG: helix-turn-helix domain-containing protein [Candidatus Binataceae bacterium]
MASSASSFHVNPLPGPAWAETLSAEQIPAALAQLAALQGVLSARLLGVRASPASSTSSDLVDAPELARRLNLHESWVRTAGRQGRIPVVQCGRYVRFRVADVEAALNNTREKSGLPVNN